MPGAKSLSRSTQPKEETMNARRIEGAVPLVTGSNRGIGRALTEALLTRGVRKVYATARNPEALRALRDERLVSLRLDVTDADQIRAAAEAASDVELVFNNAGVAICERNRGFNSPRPSPARDGGELLRASAAAPAPGAFAGQERRRCHRQHGLGGRPDQ